MVSYIQMLTSLSGEWYEDGLLTFYTSNQLSHVTESEHNKELTQR